MWKPAAVIGGDAANDKKVPDERPKAQKVDDNG